MPKNYALIDTRTSLICNCKMYSFIYTAHVTTRTTKECQNRTHNFIFVSYSRQCSFFTWPGLIIIQLLGGQRVEKRTNTTARTTSITTTRRSKGKRRNFNRSFQMKQKKTLQRNCGESQNVKAKLESAAAAKFRFLVARTEDRRRRRRE